MKRSQIPGFGELSAPFTAKDGDWPPPYPPGPDPRMPACCHDWPTGWDTVQKGDRQHECLSCRRWIWERAIWPEGAQSGRCPHGDDTCPCQDGDLCHYEGDDPMRCPLSGVVGCTAHLGRSPQGGAE